MFCLLYGSSVGIGWLKVPWSFLSIGSLNYWFQLGIRLSGHAPWAKWTAR